MAENAREKRHTLDDLLVVMARLRDPEGGCPWDVKQNFATIAPYTIEEAYEVADAIARDDLEALKDELGDLLLQVVYHAQMAAEQSRFDFADVVDAITRKMIRRHPHVFADPIAAGCVSHGQRCGSGSRPRKRRSAARVPLARPRVSMTCRSRCLRSRAR